MIRGRLLTPASVILGVALALILSLAYTPPIQALSPGKDGSPTIGAANTVVNTYTTLAASASAGNTSIQVGSAAVLGVAPGDLILIVQMQGVSMDTGNTASYGAITNYNNVGNYEFATVYGVSGNTILLSPCGGGLQRNYTVGGGGAGTGPGRAQVIRVPQYDTLTISAGASVTAPVWNGSTGGIVAIHAQNTVTLNGAIDVSGRGFRGGVRDNATSTAGNTVYSTYRSIDSALGGEKGEGIFGFQADYDGPNNGRFSRGAPANGGGGGNAHNAGGGGGANGDNGVAWNGLGIPDTSGLNWANAWNLEVPALATNNSSGGGRGGYTFGAEDRDALTVAPGSSSWGGDYRDNVGGLGGRPLDNSGNRYFMGGGGGAGDGNNTASSDGAAGGGMVFLVTSPGGAVTGVGQIRANGADAPRTVSGGNDAPGGGGGGGSVVVSAGTLAGISIQANGGRGGNQVIFSPTFPRESEGPGGGGGGGVIATSGGVVSTSVNGGANGVTDSGAVTEFIPNGATRGASGRVTTASVTIPTSPCIGVAKAAVNVVSGTPHTVTFSVVVRNLGTEPLNNVQVTDNVAAAFAPNTVTVTGTPTVSMSGSPTLSGNPGFNGSSDTNLLAAGGALSIGASATVSFTVQVTAPGGGNFLNSATGTATGSVSGNGTSDVSQNGLNPDPDSDGNPGNNNEPTPIRLEPTLAAATLSKSFTPASVAVGTPSTLTITITNPNGTALTGATLTDSLPTGLSTAGAAATTCPGGTASRTATSVSVTNATIPANGNCTLSVPVTAAIGGTYPNTIDAGSLGTTEGVTNTAPASASLTVTGLVAPQVSKSFNPPVINSGGVSQMSIVITNPNGVDLTGASISDAFPCRACTPVGTIDMLFASPTAVNNGCGGAVTVDDTVAVGSPGHGFSIAGMTIPANGSCTITVNVTSNIPGSAATNTTSTVMAPGAPAGGPASATLLVNVAQLTTDLSVAKTGTATVNQNGPVTYTVVVTNNGPSAANGALFSDAVPAQITGVTASCGSPTGGAACGAVSVAGQNVSSTITTLPSGGSVTFTINGTASTPGAVVNTASVAPPTGVDDTNPANDQDPQSTTINPVADLAITKSGTATVNQNGAVTYTITVTNNGPSNVTGATIADNVPANLTSVTWTCSATGTAACGAPSGSGNAISLTGNINAGAGNALTIVVNGTASTAGSITNTATVTAPAGVVDATGNNSAQASTTINPVADLAVTKTGTATAQQGDAVTYTITVTNNGPSNVTGATITDNVPASVTAVTWTCAATGAAACGAPSGSGNAISLTGDINAGPGNALTIAVNGTAGGVAISNTATVAAPTGVTDPTPGNDSANWTTVVTPLADLAIDKTGTASVNQNGAVTYTITVTNNGPSNVTGATIADTVPANLTGVTWTCAATGAAACGAPSGSGNAISLTGDINAGAGNALTITVNGAASTPGDISNTATVTAPTSVTDPNALNDSSTATTTINTVADLSIDKTGTATVQQGGTVTYTITVTNNGPSSADGATISDTAPSEITGVTASCGSPTGGAVCGAVSVTGQTVNSTITTLPFGGTVTFTVSGTATTAGAITNTATVAAPTGVLDPISANNSDSQATQIDPNAGINGFAWQDTNNNGIQDAGELGLGGVTVRLYREGDTAPLFTTTSNGVGIYQFTNVPPGNYFLEYVLPGGYTYSPQDQGDDNLDSDVNPLDNRTAVFALVSGVTDASRDAGFVAATATATVGGSAWQDGNGDGIQDAGESGLAGLTVNLYLSDGTTLVDTTITDPLGIYTFPNLAPGGYIVEFQPGGFSFSPQNQGGDDTLDSDADTATGRTGVITLAAGANDQTVDAGLVDSNAFNIDSFVWLDTNGDGIQDAGEPGAGGVVVRLLRDGPTPVVVGTSVTDPTGRVMFLNLAPGDYFLEFVQPGGYAFSPVDQGGDDALDSDADATTGRTPVTSLVEGNDSTLDAGLTGPALATLGGSVWDDSNGNGVQDAGEPVRDGVTVRIYTPGGFLVATTTTSGGGLYSVANLVAGDYIVEFVPPSGTGLSPQGQGGDPALDSDPNPATGRATVTLTGGQVTDAVDAGLITSAPAPTAPPGPAPAIAIFDPALSKIGVLEAGALGLPGERVTWLFTITNVGSAAGTNIVLTDTLRPELRIDSADIDRGTVTVSGQTVTFSLPSLNPGESVAARVRTTVLSRPDGNTIVNEGVLTGTGSGGETVRRTAAAQISVPGALPATGYAPMPDNATPAALVGGAAVILALAGLIALRRRRAR